MPLPTCQQCQSRPAVVLRPKNKHRLCRPCFIQTFEDEVHQTITTNKLFHQGERVAIGASGGKDSTVLAAVLKTLNERYDYGVEFVLLSIDEGIKGYRDDSLDTVKKNAEEYGMKLVILGYDELYGWTMDKVVETIGKKGNCTYCGVFRRQALDRGASRLEIKHVVTGHNADDIAETVFMNCGPLFTGDLGQSKLTSLVLRADLPRLSRATSIVTESTLSPIKRSKPLKYAYEKEIVLYAYHRKLLYFSTECIYSPEAFRGSARALIKDLERIRPGAILDVVRSGEQMAKLVPAAYGGRAVPEDDAGPCGGAGTTEGSDMARIDRELEKSASELDQSEDMIQRESDTNSRNEIDFTQHWTKNGLLSQPGSDPTVVSVPEDRKVETAHAHASTMQGGRKEIGVPEPDQKGLSQGDHLIGNEDPKKLNDEAQTLGEVDAVSSPASVKTEAASGMSADGSIPIRTRKTQQKDEQSQQRPGKNRKQTKVMSREPRQKLQQCKRCGYLSSQELCKACVLLDGLNQTRARVEIELNP
jgi:cytoplasmic tRNA 2-thiolation protein 1